MKLSRNTIIAIAVIGVLLLVAAYYLFGGKQDNFAVVEETTAASDVELRFLTLASTIQPLRLDTELLTNARFVQLVDIRTRVSTEAEGRANPFAPLTPSTATSSASLE